MRIGTEKEVRKLQVLRFMCEEINKRERSNLKRKIGKFGFTHIKEVKLEFSNTLFLSCDVYICEMTSYNGERASISGGFYPSMHEIYNDFALYDDFGETVSLIRSLYKNGFSHYKFGRKDITLEVTDYTNFKEKE